MMVNMDYSANMDRHDWPADIARDRLERALAESRAEVREAWAAVDSKAGWEWKKRAEQAEARAERLAGLLRQCRDEMAGLPHALGYDFTHLPKIDAALEQEPQE